MSHTPLYGGEVRSLTTRIMLVMVAFVITAILILGFMQANLQRQHIHKFANNIHQPYVDDIIKNITNEDILNNRVSDELKQITAGFLALKHLYIENIHITTNDEHVLYSNVEDPSSILPHNIIQQLKKIKHGHTVASGEHGSNAYYLHHTR